MAKKLPTFQPAYVITAKGERVATIAFKYPREGGRIFDLVAVR